MNPANLIAALMIVGAERGMQLKASVAPKYAALASVAASGHRIVLQSSSLPLREVKEISTEHRPSDGTTTSKPRTRPVELLATLIIPTKQATMQQLVPGRHDPLCMLPACLHDKVGSRSPADHSAAGSRHVVIIDTPHMYHVP